MLYQFRGLALNSTNFLRVIHKKPMVIVGARNSEYTSIMASMASFCVSAGHSFLKVIFVLGADFYMTPAHI